MSNLVDKVDVKEISFGAFGDLGLEDTGLELDATDFKMTKMKLMQSTSAEVIEYAGKVIPGQFFNSSTKEGVSEIDCTPLSISKTMVMWKKPFKKGAEPLCQSFDAKTKIPDGCGDGVCLTCQYSSLNKKAWDEYKKKGDTKPPCNMSYVLLGIDNKTNDTFRMICSGSSVDPTKAFINVLVKKTKTPCLSKFTIKTKLDSNDMGTFYTLKFEDLRPNDSLFNADGTLDRNRVMELREEASNLIDLFRTDLAAKDISEQAVIIDNEEIKEEDALF